MESKTKDIGIITMHRVLNYGSLLQAYATQCVLENMGYSCDIIDYMYPNKFQSNQGNPYSARTVKSKISKVLGLRSYWRKLKKFELFYKRNLKLSLKYDSPSDILHNPPRYKCYVTGSDQVWNPQYTKGDLTFLLDFAVDSPKIAYASSFACNALPSWLNERYGGLLSKYSAISVREKNGAQLIKNLLNRDVPVVLDPTLLLSLNEWMSLLQIKLRKNKKGYILVYILKYAVNPSSVVYDIIEKLQEATRLHVVFIGEEGFVKGKGWKCIETPSPKQFVQLFAESSYVVTSSFHGTAFGVNFGKPIFSIVDSNSSDDRISTLLKEVGLDYSIFSINSPIANLPLEQDIETAQKKLSSLRDLSLAFLKQSVNEAFNENKIG